MTALEIQMGSVIAHLLEYIDTGVPADLHAAQAVLMLPDVQAFADEARKGGLLPARRDGCPPFGFAPKSSGYTEKTDE